MNIFWGFVLVILGYGILMGLWWNIQQTLMDKKVGSSIIRMISGLMAGSILIPLSFFFYGVPTNISLKLGGSLLVAICLNVIIAYCFVAAAEKAGAALGAHVQVLGPMVSLFVGKILLNELPHPIGIVGILITLVGVYILHKDSKETSLFGPIKKLVQEWKEWLGYAVVLGICGGIAVPFDKINILLTNSMLAPGITLFIGWGVFYLGVTVWKNRGIVKKTSGETSRFWSNKIFWLLIIVGLCFGIANGFQGIAYKLVPTAVMVTTLKRVDALWAVLFVLTIFPKNRDKKPFRPIGAVVIFLGLVIMGLSNLF